MAERSDRDPNAVPSTSRDDSAGRFCVAIAPGAPLDRIGGKARSLLRLAEAGLPVPPAFAVTTDLYAWMRAAGPALPAGAAEDGALPALAAAAESLRAAPWPPGFLDELNDHLRALVGAERFSVRSSAAVEDQAGTLAAGLFESRVNVARGGVEPALRAVLATALMPGVRAYLAAHGRDADVQLAVLVHPFVAGSVAGTAAVDIDSIVEARGPVTAAIQQRLKDALATLRARHGAVEVEWVATDDELVFLQLRPYQRGSARRTEADGWRWDAAHNPLPLSPAQAGLVALVEARAAVPFAQRVVNGYLFYRDRQPARPAPAAARSPRQALRDVEALGQRRLATPESLESALETFVAIYEPLFGDVQPAARRARNALAARLSELGVPAGTLPALLAGVPSAATARAAAAEQVASAASEPGRATARAAYVAAFGDEAAVWDVAAPTWRETPDTIPARAPSEAKGPGPGLADAIRRDLAEADLPAWDRLLAEAREAAAVAEDDDALYARAQTHVRRALLAEGTRLAAAGVLDSAHDVFWLPLDVVRRAARGEAKLDRSQAARLVTAARDADRLARAAPPELPAANLAGAAGLVRGRPGAPGARVGRVRHWPPSGGSTGPELEVLVARTILPTELPLISAAALVVETGGVLDHVAAQARERGIPAVVGATGALDALREGDRVLVDGDAGVVARLELSASAEKPVSEP